MRERIIALCTHPVAWESIPETIADKSPKYVSMFSDDFLTIASKDKKSSLDVFIAVEDRDFIEGLAFHDMISDNFLLICCATSYETRCVELTNKLSCSLRIFKMFPIGANWISEGRIIGDFMTCRKAEMKKNKMKNRIKRRNIWNLKKYVYK